MTPNPDLRHELDELRAPDRRAAGSDRRRRPGRTRPNHRRNPDAFDGGSDREERRWAELSRAAARADDAEPSAGVDVGRRGLMLIIFCVSSVSSIVWPSGPRTRSTTPIATCEPSRHWPQTRRSRRPWQPGSPPWSATALDGLIESDGLLDRERVLAAPLIQMVEEYVAETVQTFVTSDRFPEIWEQINRAAHPIVSGDPDWANRDSLDRHGERPDHARPDAPHDRGSQPAAGTRARHRRPHHARPDRHDLRPLRVGGPGPGAGHRPPVRGYRRSPCRSWPWSRWSAYIALLGSASPGTDLERLSAWPRRWPFSWCSCRSLVGGRWINLPASVNPAAAESFFDTIGRYMRDAARLLGLIGTRRRGAGLLHPAR